MSFLLDTNVISETRRRQPDPLVMSWLRSVNPADMHGMNIKEDTLPTPPER